MLKARTGHPSPAAWHRRYAATGCAGRAAHGTMKASAEQSSRRAQDVIAAWRPEC